MVDVDTGTAAPTPPDESTSVNFGTGLVTGRYALGSGPVVLTVKDGRLTDGGGTALAALAGGAIVMLAREGLYLTRFERRRTWTTSFVEIGADVATWTTQVSSAGRFVPPDVAALDQRLLVRTGRVLTAYA